MLDVDDVVKIALERHQTAKKWAEIFNVRISTISQWKRRKRIPAGARRRVAVSIGIDEREIKE